MMRKFHVFRLHFNRTLHLGRGTDFYDRSESVLHSDTLYAAITATAAQVGLKPENLPDFVLSSAFPFVGAKGNTAYFFPRIVMPQISYEEEESTARKTLKNLRWLNKADFENAISGKSFPAYHALNDRIVGSYLFGANDQKLLPFTSEVEQRVKVPRMEGKDSEPFYIEKLFFRKNAGFYVLADCDDFSADWLEKIFKLLGENGIGTDRNVGCGHFELQRDVMEVSLPDDATNLATLSLYLPDGKDELKSLLEGDGLRLHRLVERGGWISTEPYQTLRKKTICMFEEGAVFGTGAGAPGHLGAKVDLKPTGIPVSHPIWRSGKSIFIPVKTTEK